MGKELKPIKNLRTKIPHVCATCKSGQWDDGSYVCLRPDGPVFDVGEMRHWYSVCDLYMYGEDSVDKLKER